MQQYISNVVADGISKELQSEVSISKIELAPFNRVILDDVLLKDRAGKDMLKMPRMSATFDLWAILKGKIHINSVQIFGAQFNLYKNTPHSVNNFDFVLQTLARRKANDKQLPIDLKINSLIIRRCKLNYDILSEKETEGVFNTSHISLDNIVGNISLKVFQSDSINLNIKRLSVDELYSGFSLNQLEMKVNANNKQMSINDLRVKLTNSDIKTEKVEVSYQNLDSLYAFRGNIDYIFNLRNSKITLKDISPFVPIFSHINTPLYLNTTIKGNENSVECEELKINDLTKDTYISAKARIENFRKPYIYGKINKLKVSSKGISLLDETYSGLYNTVKQLGDIEFTGEIEGELYDIRANGQLRSSIGDIDTDIKVGLNRETKEIKYKGKINAYEFDLGKLLNERKLGKTVISIETDGRYITKKVVEGKIKGDIKSIVFNKYTYNNIKLDGNLSKNKFVGKVSIDDENGKLDFLGNIDLSSSTPKFDFNAKFDNIDLKKINITEKETNIGLNIKADFEGKSIKDMIGVINIDSIKIKTEEVNHKIDNINIASVNQDDSNKKITVKSDFIDATLSGSFDYTTLQSSIQNIIKHYIPSILPNINNKYTNNNFTLKAKLKDTGFVTDIFELPFKLYNEFNIDCELNDKDKTINLKANAHYISYKNHEIDNPNISIISLNNSLITKTYFSDKRTDKHINFYIDNKILNDNIHSEISWGNDETTTYSGKVKLDTRFKRSEDNKSLITDIDIYPTDIILYDTVWNISKSNIVIEQNTINIDNFKIHNKDKQHIIINGKVSESKDDNIKAQLKDVNIEYIFELLNLKNSVDFSGSASGDATIADLFSKPYITANLFVKSLALNKEEFGNSRIRGSWDNDYKGIKIDADIDVENSKSSVSGYIYPLKEKSGIDISINADKLNIGFLQFYMKDITKKINGIASGKVRLYGRFDKLNLQGSAYADANLFFDVLNTSYNVKDSIKLSPNGITLDNCNVYDTNKNRAIVDGKLSFKHFKDFSYLINVKTSNTLLLDIPQSDLSSMYGTIYGTGTGVIRGNDREGVNIEIDMQSAGKTHFTYNINSITSAAENNFIKYVDSTPNRRRSKNQKENVVNPISNITGDVKLNIKANITEDAKMSLILDNDLDNSISCSGNGNIQILFHNKNGVKILGDYNILKGKYNLSLQDVIHKTFDIEEGSKVTFEGNPLEALMSVKSSYIVNSVSLRDIIPDGGDVLSHPSVKVKCIVNVNGTINSPNMSFNIELPNDRDELQTLVKNHISTPEEMQTQVLFLLSTGKFYAVGDNNIDNRNSVLMSSLLSSAISGKLNNTISRMLNSTNWSLGTNISTGSKGWTDVEIEGLISGSLLNNRILINGNIGYRDNPTKSDNMIGDFELEYLFTKSGVWRGRYFNKTNDRYFTKTDLRTTGIGLMYKKDFDKWTDFLFWRKWRKKSKKQKTI